MKDWIARLRGDLFRLRVRFFHKRFTAGPGLRIYRRFRFDGQGSVRIGRNCRIDGIRGDDSQYVCLDTLAPEALIVIGDNASLYAARIVAKYQVTMQDDCLIEESGIVDTDFHAIERGRQAPAGESKEACRISIGNRVCVGARSCILKGVTIGDDVVVAPGTIVSTSVRAGSFVRGNPGRCATSTEDRDGGE